MFVESSVVFFMMIFFFLMLRRPTRSTRTDTLFPCAPRFRYRRRRGRVIRLELEEDIPDALELTVREGLRAGEALTFESTGFLGIADLQARSEEHTSELQSLKRISYDVFCLKQTKKRTQRLQQHPELVHV